MRRFTCVFIIFISMAVAAPAMPANFESGETVVQADYSATFHVKGVIKCNGICPPDKKITLRLIDTGLDDSNSTSRYAFDNQDVVIGEPIEFRSDYFWGTKKKQDDASGHQGFTVSANAEGCNSIDRIINIDQLSFSQGVFDVPLGDLVIECPCEKN